MMNISPPTLQGGAAMARKETPFRFWPPWRNPSSSQRPPAPPARTPPPPKPTPLPVPPQSQPPPPSATAPSPRPSSPSRPSQPASPPPSPVPPRSQPSPPRAVTPSPPPSPRSSQLALQEDSKAEHETAQGPMPPSPERPPPSSTPPPSPVPPRSPSSSSRPLQPASHENTKEQNEGAQGPMTPPSPEQPPPSSMPPLPVLPQSQPLSPPSLSRSQPASREEMKETIVTAQGPMPLSLQESRRPHESEEHKTEAKENDDAEQPKKLSLMEKQQETKRDEERAQSQEEQEFISALATKPREPVNETNNEEKEAERPSTSSANDANELVTNMKISTRKQEEEENMEEAAPRKEKLYIPISHAPLSDFSHGAGRSSYQAQIKDATSKLVQKLNIGSSQRPGNGNGVEVITLAGENKGATMTLSFEEGETHNSRSAGGSSGREESGSVINSNVQNINNSLLQESSCSEINAGVHLIGVARDGACCKRRMQMSDMPRGLSQQQQQQQQPAIRRRCLRGLFADPSDGEADVVPQRHGCRFCAIDKKKDKAEAQ